MAESAAPSGLDFGLVVKAGLIAGLVFVIVEMVLVGIMMGTPFGPPRMMAAIAMGKGVLPPPATFDLAIFLVGMIVHFILSILLAFLFGLIAPRVAGSAAMLYIAGLVFGLIVYVVNFYGFTAVFPWFANARTPVTILAHAIFGLALAWAWRPRPA